MNEDNRLIKFKKRFLLETKALNPGMKIDILDLGFHTGDDYTILEKALDPDYDPEGYNSACYSEKALLEYLLEWYIDPDNHYMSSAYDVSGINTEFLGYIRIIDNMLFLLSHNTRIGYVGLSKILI